MYAKTVDPPRRAWSRLTYTLFGRYASSPGELPCVVVKNGTVTSCAPTPLRCATKSYFGHCLGAAGALEATITIIAVCCGALLPTLRLTKYGDSAWRGGRDLNIGMEFGRLHLE